MTNHDKSTGSTGTMRITDTGSRIEFWLKAGSATFSHQLPYGYTVNGTTDNSNSFDFKSGGNWQMLKSWSVTTSQTVTFRLQDTGTGGLGGPTTLAVSISRSKAPDAPSKPTVSAITSSSAYITFTDGDNNGASITSRQIGYGKTTGNPTTTVSSDRSTTVTGLTSGTRYYFRARTHNSEGYSAWGAYTGITTLDEPGTPGVVTLNTVTQTSVLASFKDTDTGGAAILQRQIGYGTSPSAPLLTAEYAGPTTIKNLKPSTKYYFWSRSRNAIGWSSWSAVSSTTTLAGAKLKVGGVWVNAVPYVRVSGVWKPARPWTKQFGFWEESS